MRAKDIYVINLNSKRMLLLSGVFFMIVGTTLWLGLKIGSTRTNAFSEDKLTSIAEEVGIDYDEFKKMDLLKVNPNVENLDLKVQTPMFASALEIESKKVPPLQSLKTSPKEDYSTIKLMEHDPLEKKIKRYSNAKNKKFFSIQVAAFKKERHAKSLLKRMKADGFSNLRVKRGARFYYVRMGNSPTKDKLILENEKVKKMLNVQTIIIRTDS